MQFSMKLINALEIYVKTVIFLTNEILTLPQIFAKSRRSNG